MIQKQKTIRRLYWRPSTLCSIRETIQQRSASGRQLHSAPVRTLSRADGLFNLIKSIPSTLRYEPGVIVAEGDFVIIHGRFSGFGLPVNWIAADIVRMKDGILLEHWDVIQDEANKEQSKSGNSMFGDSFPDRA